MVMAMAFKNCVADPLPRKLTFKSPLFESAIERGDIVEADALALEFLMKGNTYYHMSTNLREYVHKYVFMSEMSLASDIFNSHTFVPQPGLIKFSVYSLCAVLQELPDVDRKKAAITIGEIIDALSANTPSSKRQDLIAECWAEVIRGGVPRDALDGIESYQGCKRILLSNDLAI